MPKTRSVKTDRIKPFRAKGKFSYIKGHKPSQDEVRQRVSQAIAQEFARKLLQFDKIRIWEEGFTIRFETALEVIVPETPKKKKAT